MSDDLIQTEDAFEDDLPEQIAVRLAKRDRLNEAGDAYPVSVPVTTTIDAVRAETGAEPNVYEVQIDTSGLVLNTRLPFGQQTAEVQSYLLRNEDRIRREWVPQRVQFNGKPADLRVVGRNAANMTLFELKSRGPEFLIEFPPENDLDDRYFCSSEAGDIANAPFPVAPADIAHALATFAATGVVVGQPVAIRIEEV